MEESQVRIPISRIKVEITRADGSETSDKTPALLELRQSAIQSGGPPSAVAVPRIPIINAVIEQLEGLKEELIAMSKM